jgi:hypothetical protein
VSFAIEDSTPEINRIEENDVNFYCTIESNYFKRPSFRSRPSKTLNRAEINEIMNYKNVTTKDTLTNSNDYYPESLSQQRESFV